MSSNHDLSATKIQLLWRRFCSSRIYSYFRDLIINKLKGAPFDILKTVIPDEANLLDRSAGVHVKFRLGGAIFPPKIFFKIFVHQPLCDVGAFAPRDYSLEKSTDLLHKLSIASKIDPRKITTQKLRVGARYFDAKVTTTVHFDKWYKREENNPWRPILSNKLDEILTPPWLRNNVTNQKQPPHFHYSRLKRKEDVLRHKRQRKREWMMKAYMYAAKINEVEDSGLVLNEIDRIQREHEQKLLLLKTPMIDERKAPIVVPREKATVQSSILTDMFEEIDDVSDISTVNISKTPLSPEKELIPEDWKDDDLFFNNPSTDEDLIKWSLTLNYNEYCNNWNRLATSMPSDMDKKHMYKQAVNNSQAVKIRYPIT